MNVLRLALVFTVGLSLVSGLAHAADTINWLTSVPEGTFSDAANWTGGVIPTNNTIGTFSGNQTYTIHFPAGGYAENSATKVNLSSSRSLTFDTRGTWWLKDAPTITNGWPTSWTGFTIANSSGSHLFNIEGLLTSAAATNYPIMCLSNAVYRYYSSATVTNVLEEGLLNLYDPKGITYSSLSLITGSAGTRHVAIFKTNSTLRATQIRMRGNAYGNYMIFEGGDHAIYNGLCVGEGATNAGYTNTVQVTGGTLSLPASYLYIGYGKTNSCGEFSVSGDGVVTVGNQIAMANYQGQSLASLKLSDRGVLRAGTYLDAAYNTSSTATISLANSALLSVGSNLAVARGNSSFSTLDLRDQSVCTAGGYLLIGGYSASDGTVSVRDGAVLTVGNYVEVGTSSGTGRLELDGGRLVAKNVRGGAGGWSELHADGGTLCASNISASVNLLVNFDLAELGAAGLTLDSAGYDATVGQAFTDASGADGLFLKTGAGTLSVSNSTHALTVVAQGGLRVLDASATFGRTLVVTNQASLSLVGAATNLTVGSLTLGETGSPASLYLDTGDLITVTNSGGLSVAGCGIFFGSASVNGTYPLIHCAGSVDGSVLSHLAVFNPVAGKDYMFAAVPDGADSVIQLSVSDLTVSDALWNGSLGSDWNTADNWTPAALPTNGTRAFFTESGAQKTVTLSAPAACTAVNFDSASPYTLQGAQLSLPAGGISNNLGSHTVAAPLALAGSFAVLTASASTTTVSGTISATIGTAISKSGSGTLVVSGDNAAFNGLWQSSSGRLHVASASALGVANAATNALVLGAGTFTYSGPSATLTKGLTLSAGNTNNAVIFEALSDLTLNTTLSVQPSLFCKRGTAALTLDVGSGTTTLSVGAGSGGVNITPSGTIVLPDNGDAPASATGLGGFNVIEGLIRIKGAGAGSTTVNQQHFGIIGGQYAAAQADAVLELDAVRFAQGSAGQHLLLGNQMSASSSARTPTLRLVNGSVMTLDHLRMGVSPSTTFAPTLILSNSSITASWQLSIGANNDTAPVVRLMQGSTATATGGNQWGGGILIARNVDILVAENSVLAQTGTAGGNFFRFSDAYSSGAMRFESGGTMRFARFLGYNYLTTAGLNVYFNGGVMEPIASGDSISTALSKQSFIIEAGGLTLSTGSGIRHGFHFPLTGAGALTKTGPGEAIFGTGWSYAPGATNLSGLATGDYTGGTTIQEGTLSVSNGTIRADAAVAVEPGATLNLSAGSVTLGEVSGSGIVSNGVLTAGYRCHVTGTGNDRIALADVSLPTGWTVTFALADGVALTNRQTLAVATRAGTTDLNLASWRAANVGDKLGASFTLVGDTVYANVFFSGGTLITVE
mgnify:CR=1 FL=1